MNKPNLPNKLAPKIKDGQRITIIGLGGVGEKVARNAALFLAASNVPVTLTLVDGDSYEPSNINRQMFLDFGNKAEVISRELLPKFAEGQLSIFTLPEYLTPANMHLNFVDGDIILMCVDNHKTRKMVSDWCSTMNNVTLISGGNDGVTDEARGTYGNVQIYIRKDGMDVTEPLSLYHPEINNPVDKRPDEKSCTDNMQRTPQLLISNLFVAANILSALYLHLSGALSYSEVCFDWADAKTNVVLEKDL